MIKYLKGIHETVDYKENTNICLYMNEKTENYPAHWHTALEIIMPLENQYTIIHNQDIHIIETDEIVIILPGVIHTLRAPHTGKRIIFQAELSVLNSIKEFKSILSFLPPIFNISKDSFPSIHPKLHQSMLVIEEEYSIDNTLSEAIIYSRLIEMFVLIGRNYSVNWDKEESGSLKQKEYTEKFLSICYYIDNHCAEELTLDKISALAGFSKFHFTRLFKQFTNVSFYKYVNQKRIALAEIFLIDPELTITEVALRSGFSSPSAFVRMFKLIKNCTPTQFRQMYSS